MTVHLCPMERWPSLVVLAIQERKVDRVVERRSKNVLETNSCEVRYETSRPISRHARRYLNRPRVERFGRAH